MTKFRLGPILAIGFAANVWATPYAPHVPGELIVKLKSSNSQSLQNSFIASGAEVKASLRDNLVLVRVSGEKSLSGVISELSQNQEVEYAEPNFIYSIVKPVEELTLNSLMAPLQYRSNFTPNDPKYGELWGLKNTGNNDPSGAQGVAGADISAEQAWAITKGDRAIRIAVIDTGVEYNHPDLADNMWVNTAEKNGQPNVDDDNNGYVDDIYGYDFANDDADPTDGHSHGTHCAGTIGAVHNNNEGVAGVMGDVSLVAIKFLSDGGSGSTANAIRAIDYATSLNVDVMSNSWGGGGRSEALKEAIQRASDKGILFAAAAGNSSSNNDSRPHYPSNYATPNMISVAAHTSADILASFSSYGRNTVHIAAPGHKITSCVKNGSYGTYSGTSMATPHVAGAVGLLLSQTGRLDHAEFRERLLKTSVPIRAYRGKMQANGRLNVHNLLTDTRPPRNEPNPEDWETVTLEEAFQSAHPYASNQDITKVIEIPGAKFVRVVVKKYEFERGYDYLSISGADGTSVEKVSGSGENYVTDYIEGETLNIKFHSDRSVNKWGFVIERIQVIRNSNVFAQK